MRDSILVSSSVEDWPLPHDSSDPLDRQPGDNFTAVKLTDLRGILQYVPQFREKVFILAIDGDIVTDDNFATLLVDVALLWSLNIRIVLVHGAAAQIKALADERRVP